MGIRESLNQNPKLVTPLTIAVIGVAVGYILLQFFASPPPAEEATQGYFTVDEGKTVFVDQLSEIPPYHSPHGIAYRALVYSCDKGKTRFVAYLLRYRREGDPVTGQLIGSAPSYLEAQQIKRTGTDDWINMEDFDTAQKILNVICPDGQPATPVYPKR